MVQWDTTKVNHILRQTSDHSMLLLDSRPQRRKTRARFIFDSQWTKMEECEEIIKEVWNTAVTGSRMFKMKQKLKWCKLRFIKWRKQLNGNARNQIEIIQKEMETIQQQGGTRSWEVWKQLKAQLDEAYKSEEVFWSRKSRVNWLKEGDRNTKYFHAVTTERRKRNRIHSLQTEGGAWDSEENEIAGEIAKYFENLFTSENYRTVMKS